MLMRIYTHAMPDSTSADAVNVNSLDAIVDRAHECQRERGLIPNYIAVNFYSIGDLTEAVAKLNGLE